MLEKCDKIWETLQLIKTMQPDYPTESDNSNTEEEDDDKTEDNDEQEEEEKKEEHVQQKIKIEPPCIKSPSMSRHSNASLLPFKFSVQRTKRLYPCSTCGKQYMEKRSLRKHAERVHGIIIPLQRRRTFKKLEIKKVEVKAKEPVPVIPPSKKDHSEKPDEKHLPEKIPAKIKVPNTKKIRTRKIYAVANYIKCVLCKRKVKSLKDHLIHYHKIAGASTNIAKWQSLNANKPSSSEPVPPVVKKTSLKDILSGRPPQKFTNENTREQSRITNNADVEREYQVRKKRKHTLPHVKEEKKLKLNNEHYIPVHNTTAIASRRKSINLKSYKCDICLGTYASSHGLYKHRRVHRIRGETKENFHKFQCRYFNSPLNKKRFANAAVKNLAKTANGNANETVQPSSTNIKQTRKAPTTHQTSTHKRNINENLICLCGKICRYSHTLFIHKNNCKLFIEQQKAMQEEAERLSSDKDSGIGINITIKKRDDGYEIVGKDSDEEKSQKSVHFKDDISSSNVTENDTKGATNAATTQEILDTSKYSKDHSILKLKITDEDEIIDIEDDLQTDLGKSNKVQQVVAREKDKDNDKVTKDSLVQQKSDEDVPGVTVSDKVATLTQMCQKILNTYSLQTHTANTDVVENKNKKVHRESKQRKRVEMDQENIQVLGQEVNYKNKRELRSNKRQKNMDEEFDYSCDEVLKTELLTACGYCDEQFSTTNCYSNHQCTVHEGKLFDEFSLELLCFYCDEVLNSYSEFDQHMQFEHFDNSFHCYQCTERFETDKKRVKHIQADHDMRCRFCNTKLSLSLKVLHESYHLGFGFPCHTCKKAYSNKKNLSYHRYTIHPLGGDNLITCTLCLKPIKLKSFRGHMATHKHNACHFCGKVFSNRTNIEYHTMIHHGTNSKLKCNVCGARFLSKKLLVNHEKNICNNGMKKEEGTAMYNKSH